MNARPLLAALAALIFSCSSAAEDGYDLWLRDPALKGARADEVRRHMSVVVLPERRSPVLANAGEEFGRAAARTLAQAISVETAPSRDGAVILGTPASSPHIARLSLPLQSLGEEGYLIRSVIVGGHKATVIAASGDVGVLYGVFHFFRLVQSGQSLDDLDVSSRPHTKIRLLNHWDNLDQHVERGYAGQSIW